MSTTLEDTALCPSRWIEGVETSPTVALSARAQALKREGRDILNATAGEPDFDTPAHIREAAKRAIDEGRTHYTPAGGIPELREAIARLVASRTGHEVARGQVVVTCGAKLAVYIAVAALVEPGDEVLIPAPFWVSYPPMVKMAGGRPAPVWAGPEQAFKLTVEDLETASTDRTRGLIFNSPNNPTGSVYTRAETRAIADWAAERKLWIVSDEIYAALRYVDEPYLSMLSADPRGSGGTILCDGFSKAYAMTGWRVGYLVAPTAIANAAVRVLEQTTSNTSTISQYAALAALSGPQEPVHEMVTAFRSRRDALLAELQRIPGLVYPTPPGAFYLFVDIRAFLKRKTPQGRPVQTSEALCEYLLESVGLALVPGEGFGAPGFVRISYASGEDALRDAAARLERGLSALR